MGSSLSHFTLPFDPPNIDYSFRDLSNVLDHLPPLAQVVRFLPPTHYNASVVLTALKHVSTTVCFFINNVSLDYQLVNEVV